MEPDEPLASPYIFGLNVDGLVPGRAVVLDDNAFGWPARRLSSLPAGDYLIRLGTRRGGSHELALLMNEIVRKSPTLS